MATATSIPLCRGFVPSTFLGHLHSRARVFHATHGSYKFPKARILLPVPALGHVKCAASTGDRNRYTRFQDKREFEPSWLSSVKDVVWGVRSLVLFLLEQPGQLKYIEWPTFQNTLKTAILTLVLVAALIVALSSIDAGLSFLLTTFLRKKG